MPKTKIEITGMNEPDSLCRMTRVDDMYDVYMKWDGCIEITHDDQSFHICDVDRFIQQLEDIEEFRLKEIPGAE